MTRKRSQNKGQMRRSSTHSITLPTTPYLHTIIHTPNAFINTLFAFSSYRLWKPLFDPPQHLLTTPLNVPFEWPSYTQEDEIDDASAIENEDEDQDDMNDAAEVETEETDEWTDSSTTTFLWFELAH